MIPARTKLFVRDAGAAPISSARRGPGAAVPPQRRLAFRGGQEIAGRVGSPLVWFMGWCYEVKFDSVKISGSAVLGFARRGIQAPRPSR